MLKYIWLCFLSVACLAASSHDLVVNNRILTSVNGKTISMLDVVKQMDLFLSEHYPQYLELEGARLQFYAMQWRPTLQRMIDQELMMADAESREIKATDAEVREEIQNRYGPNVMETLDKLEISYEEAKQAVHQELVVQKIQWLRVTSKVLSKVTTDIVKKAFDEYVIKNPSKATWTYQFVTLRFEDVEKALFLAEEIAKLHETAGGALATALELFKSQMVDIEWSSLSLSSEMISQDKELSESHRSVLSQMKPGMWSTPIVQQSRDGSQVVRIFHLKSHTQQEAPLFETVAQGIRQDLLNQYAEKEMGAYLSRLHARFNYSPSSLDIPPHFEPFSIDYLKN